MNGECYEREYPVRKNPRLANFDYSSPNDYFVTICTHEKKCIFGTPGQLNPMRIIAEHGLSQVSDHYQSVKVDKFVVMPNHVHAIIVITGGTADVPNVIGQYKAFVTKEIHKINPNIRVWQTSFHDHVIRNQKSYEKIWEYIDGNPVKWNEDCFYIGSEQNK